MHAQVQCCDTVAVGVKVGGDAQIHTQRFLTGVAYKTAKAERQAAFFEAPPGFSA